MSDNRHVVFWIAVLASLVAAITLLHDVLVPFVTGMVLAYLLDPLANRLVRLGMNRGLATLAIIAAVVLLITGAVFFTAPVIGRELSFFVKTFPLYVERLHTHGLLASIGTLTQVGATVGGGAEYMFELVGAARILLTPALCHHVIKRLDAKVLHRNVEIECELAKRLPTGSRQHRR